MSLRLRIALSAAVAVAMAIGLAGFVTFTLARSRLIAEVDESLAARAEIAVNLGDLGKILALRPQLAPRRPPRSLFDRGARGFDAIFFQGLDAGGAVVFPPVRGAPLPVGEADLAVLAGDAPRALRTVDTRQGRLRMLTVPTRAGAIQIARSLDEVDATLHGLANALQLAGLLGIGLAALAGLVIARRAVGPIGELAGAAEHVARTQDLEARIEVKSDDEVGRLAASFNAMLAALAGSREQQSRLVHDAGHELRTPLTALRTNVDLLATHPEIPAAERAAMVDDIRAEVAELSALTAELVELAAAEESADRPRSATPLGALVDGVVARYRRRTGRVIELNDAGGTVTVDTARLERAVGNLLDNACKWSPAGAGVTVTVTGGTVEVADTGPGISPEDRPYVFDRFYRATRDRSTPGSGLGLAIVSKVAVDHGGRAFVGNSKTGAVVGFEIPCTPPAVSSADS